MEKLIPLNQNQFLLKMNKHFTKVHSKISLFEGETESKNI